jgi:hypothetical protein
MFARVNISSLFSDAITKLIVEGWRLFAPKEDARERARSKNASMIRETI